MAGMPGIQQSVGGAGIETDDISGAGSRGQQGQVGESPQVEHQLPLVRAAKQYFMKGWRQGSRLSAGGEIATAEVGNHSATGQLGQQTGVVELQSIGRTLLVAPGGVLNGLPMAANSRDLRGLDTLAGE